MRTPLSSISPGTALLAMGAASRVAATLAVVALLWLCVWLVA